MQEVDLSPTPAQTLSVVLNQQNCRINLYQKRGNMFFDLSVDGVVVTTCVLCRNGVPLNNRGGSTFVGNFMFVDSLGSVDPTWDGLGIRFKLLYIEPGDV